MMANQLAKNKESEMNSRVGEGLHKIAAPPPDIEARHPCLM